MKQKLKQFAIDSLKAIGFCMAALFIAHVILGIVFPYTPYVRANPYQYSDAFYDAQTARIDKEVEAKYTAKENKEWNDLKPVILAKCKKSVKYYEYSKSEGFMMNCDGAYFTYESKSKYPSAWINKKQYVMSKDKVFKNKLISIWKKSPHYEQHLKDEVVMKQVTELMDKQCMQLRMRKAESHQAVKKALPDLFKDDPEEPNMSLGKK